MVHQGTHHSITLLNTTRQTHHDGCKTQPYQWTLAVQGHPTVDEEEEALSEEEEANMDNTTINLPIASRTMLQPRETLQTLASNVDK